MIWPEGCREAQAWRGVGGEFVVTPPDVLHERVAGSDPCGRTEAFESAHRRLPSLQPTVIGFDPVVVVLLGDVRGGRDQVVEYPQVRGGLVRGHLNRRRLVNQRVSEEPAGGRGVPLL